MALTIDADLAIFADAMTAEDAEPLLAWMQAHPDGTMDLAAATQVHTAVLQLLLLATQRVARPFDDPFLARWVRMPGHDGPDELATAV